jgi:hypothetical protein
MNDRTAGFRFMYMFGKENGTRVWSSVADMANSVRGWRVRQYPISMRFQMVVPYPLANPCYAMNKMG